MLPPISVDALGKRFARFDPDRPRTFQEAVSRGWRRLRAVDSFWALRDISFEVGAGEMMGVIGANGAGKSTLLRLVGGVGKAEEGAICTRGRIGALLELGSDFHPDLSGRENVFVTGVVSGLRRKEVAERFDDIVAFAELESFIDSPLRTYSTGMQMRLAFAVAAHINPDILLIDEVLAVGDLSFQEKCLERIRHFKEDGTAILLVSHDMNVVRELCDQAIWLREGHIVSRGSPNAVVGQYSASMRYGNDQRQREARFREDGNGLELDKTRFGSLEMEIRDVRLMDGLGQEVDSVLAGAPLRVEIDYYAPEPITAPIVGVTLTRADNLICYDTSSAADGLILPTVEGAGRMELVLERLDLGAGSYFVDVGVYKSDWSYTYDYHWHVYPLQVNAPPGEKGVIHAPHRWKLEQERVPVARERAISSNNSLPREQHSS